MKKLSVAFLVVGVAALSWMVYRIGPSTLWDGLRQIGWGLAVGSALHALALALDSVTLQACVPGERPPLLHLIKTSVTGHAINEATPFGKVGEITKWGMLEQVMAKEDAAAALVAQNMIMFVVNCALVAFVPLVVALVVDAPRRAFLAFGVLGGVFLICGLVGVWILTRGIGPWPFAVLRRFGLARARVARWQQRFDAIETQWRKAAHDRRSMIVAFASGVLSRLCNVGESAVYFGLAHGDHVLAGAFLSLASSVGTGLIVFFVPFQAGSAEGGAYAIFSLVGLSSSAGVIVELARKLRRVVFIAIGLVLLAVTTATGKVGEPAARKPA
jgi:hypothetical protein